MRTWAATTELKPSNVGASQLRTPLASPVRVDMRKTSGRHTGVLASLASLRHVSCQKQ